MIKGLNRKMLIAPVAVVTTLILGVAPAFAYDVQKGDTLGDIAYNHDMTVAEIVELNPDIDNIDLIYIGDNIKTIIGTNVVNNVETDITITENVKQLLAQLVQAEASGESFAGKVAVASVVLNRVESNDFPNTVYEVIHQPRQFSPVSNGSILQVASEASKRAVEEAIQARTDHTSLFFYNSATASSRWLDTRETTFVLGNHTFKK